MKYSSGIRRGFLASLIIHGAVVAGGFLSADSRDKLVANKIEFHLTIQQQDQSDKLKETPKQENALVAIPERETIPKSIPKVLPVVETKSKVEPKPLLDKPLLDKPLLDKPLLEPGLVVKKKPEIAQAPSIDKKAESIPELLAQEIIPPDVVAEIEQVEAIESQEVVDQKKIDALVEAEINYRNEIIRLIESKKYYPKRLQKMRKEGDVLVAFTLNRNGSVKGVEVLNVKGSSLFKKAALKAIQSAALFPSFPQESSRETWSFKVPLSYRLLRS